MRLEGRLVQGRELGVELMGGVVNFQAWLFLYFHILGFQSIGR